MISEIEFLVAPGPYLHAAVDQVYFMERPEGQSNEARVNSIASVLNSEMLKLEGAQMVLTIIKHHANIDAEPYQK